MADTLFVETMHLNTLLGSEAWTYVKVGDQFVRKKAQDLHVGDTVLIRNEGINKKLGDVEPVLRESLRYSLAESGLYQTNSSGEQITQLRILLLKGLSDESTPNLESKIMLEGDDFSDEEYAQFTARIAPLVAQKPSTIRRWLKNKTIAPQDWENFYKLAQVNPELEKIAESITEDFGFYADYELYTGLRSTIMAHLAKRKADSDAKREPQKERKKHERGKFAPEIAIVVNHFSGEIDHDTSVSRITRISTVRKTDTTKPAATHMEQAHLTRGIFTGEAQLPLVDLNQIAQDSYILDTAMYDIGNRYALHHFKDSKNDLITTLLIAAFAPYLASRLMLIPGEQQLLLKNARRNAEIILGKEHLKEFDERLEQEYITFMEKLKKGEVDALLGTAHYTVVNLVDTVNQHHCALPKAYADFRVIMFGKKIATLMPQSRESTRRNRREARKELNTLDNRLRNIRAYLHQEYAIQPQEKHFFLTYHNERRGDVDASETIPQLVIAARRYKEEGVQFYTRNEVNATFARLGIPSATNIFPPAMFDGIDSQKLFGRN